MGSSPYYNDYYFTTWKLRLREVKWLGPSHTALSSRTAIPYTGLIDSRAPDLNLEVLLALSVCEGVLTMANGFIYGFEQGGALGIMTQFLLNREEETSCLRR